MQAPFSSGSRSPITVFHCLHGDEYAGCITARRVYGILKREGGEEWPMTAHWRGGK